MCTFTCTCIPVHKCVYATLCAKNVFIHVYVYSGQNEYTYIHIIYYIDVHIYTCIYVYIYIYTYIYIYMLTYMLIHRYIHIYIYTYIDIYYTHTC